MLRFTNPLIEEDFVNVKPKFMYLYLPVLELSESEYMVGGLCDTRIWLRVTIRF